MSDPVTRPHMAFDPSGRLRVKLKRGRTAPAYGQGAHAHHFDGRGMRVDRNGRPVSARANEHFRSVTWDLPEEHPEPATDPPKLAEAIALARRSPSFRTALDAVSRAGWVIALSSPRVPGGCRKGPNILSIEVDRRSELVARLVHGVMLARALASPLPILDAKAPTFVHDGAVHLLQCEGQAAFYAALVRDEIIAGRGPDIGGPGLRGSQTSTYAAFKRGEKSAAQAIEEIAFSYDARARGFEERGSTRSAMNLVRAFVEVPPASIARLGADVIVFVDRIRALRTFRVDDLSRALGVAFKPVFVVEGFFTCFSAELSTGPFARVEVREPVPNGQEMAHRILLTPSSPLSYPQLATWYGLGVPHHVDGSPSPIATAEYVVDGSAMYVTFDVARHGVLLIAFARHTAGVIGSGR